MILPAVLARSGAASAMSLTATAMPVRSVLEQGRFRCSRGLARRKGRAQPLSRSFGQVACLIGFTGLATLGLGAETMAQPPMIKLTDEELRAAIEGGVLRPGYGGLVGAMPGTTEQFFQGGVWQLVGTRAPLTGTYKVRHGQLCVEYPPGLLKCRFIFRDAAGAAFASDAAAKAARPVPITLAPLDVGANHPQRQE